MHSDKRRIYWWSIGATVLFAALTVAFRMGLSNAGEDPLAVRSLTWRGSGKARTAAV
ncbi:hypothetical protein ACGFYY_35430 [Streptomyces sp. NPDC048331]|uniref:hypothetical protein n=1 Tax=Streptomyces sp. NPDC048331 TaxID=3365534 RepID=UPI00371D7DE2